MTRKKAILTTCALILFAFALFCLSAGANQILPASLEGQSGVEVPILMYHSVLKDPARSGRYTITPQTVREDLNYLKQLGYETVTVQDLIDYVYHEQPLPDKPVMITLDDGHYNNLTYVLPILEELDMKAVISIVGEYTEQFSQQVDENANYAYLSWDNINELKKTGRFEFQNHTYHMHSNTDRKGSKRKSGESEAEYRAAFEQDVMKLQQVMQEKCGIKPTCFTYPFGGIELKTREYLKEMGFLASFSCDERVSVISSNPDSLFELGRFNRPSGISTEQFIQKVINGKKKVTS